MTGAILVIEDDPLERSLVRDLLEWHGHRVLTASTSEEALRLAASEALDCIILDLDITPQPGPGLLPLLRGSDNSGPPILVLSLGYNARTAVEVMRQHAFDFLSRPILPDELVASVARALETRQGRQASARLLQRVREEIRRHGLVASGPAMRPLMERLRTVAPVEVTVLLQGESGTGKDLLGLLIHRLSPRREAPYISVDCGALPEALIESELFGHVKGAFTGATADRSGAFAEAHRGTFFLDEVANLSLAAQAKLLRFLQNREVRRVGTARAEPLDVRVVAATNRNLATEVAARRFRADLYYRLQEFTLAIPPLRERLEDIPLLAHHFLEEANGQFHRHVRALRPQAMRELVEYPWPGNVRELRSTIRESTLMTAVDEISAEQIRALLRLAPASDRTHIEVDLARGGLKEIRERVLANAEAAVITRALREHEGNRTRTARRLAVDYKTLTSKMRLYGLDGGRRENP